MAQTHSEACWNECLRQVTPDRKFHLGVDRIFIASVRGEVIPVRRRGVSAFWFGPLARH